MTDLIRARKLRWSKEVERRVRDLYKRLYPEAQRAKFAGREDRAGHPDIVNVPMHVQVKARTNSTVGRYWREADEANFTDGPTHLVIQDYGKPPLLVMRLTDWIEEQEARHEKSFNQGRAHQALEDLKERIR